MSVTPLASFHLFRVPPRRIPVALGRMALDPVLLRGTGGLRFCRSVGTGKGQSFTLRDADPCRWGLFAVWDDDAALARFDRTSAVLRAWRRASVEQWRVDLRPLRSRGLWGGRDPFAGVDAGPSHPGGPVAAITRARIRWARARRFWQAVPAVAGDLRRHPGLLLSLGFGEAPLGLQGTLSLWASPAALSGYAYQGAAHQAAIRATRSLQWYSEELFARFEVVGSHGTVDGRDPLRRHDRATGDA